MEIAPFMSHGAGAEIKSIEMHTSGEPTRIVYAGFPDLSGTLLEQRALARSKHDHIRRAIICEPRGHKDMYGAVLRPRTELVDSGEADMGVLFLTNDGYSTMCGHATLAVSRLLVDHVGTRSDLFRSQSKTELHYDYARREVTVRLHAPCGIVNAAVPVTEVEGGGWKTDISRPISYVSVPSYATGSNITIPIPPSLRWPELGDRDSLVVDVTFGGAFYIITQASNLGFSASLAKPDIPALAEATRLLKDAFNASEELRRTCLHHPDSADLQFLYSTILTDTELGAPAANTHGAETGLCFFANSQIDRSPTGSGVQARVALAYAKGQRKLGERWTYHSLVSNAHAGEGAFVGEAVEEVEFGGRKGVTVKVSGWARYTGSCSYIVEQDDKIGKGFWFGEEAKS